MQESLKFLRLRIDELAQLSSTYPSVQEKLLYAKVWTGALLGYIGEPSPYKNDGKRKEVSDIEPADSVVSPSTPTPFDGTMNEVQKLDYLRERIKDESFQVEAITTIEAAPGKGREAAIARTAISKYLREARFEADFALGRIRDNA